VGVVCVAALGATLISAPAASATRSARAGCSPGKSVLKSPRPGSVEVQAKALNDRGDVVGFADSKHGSGPTHAILWKHGQAARAVDLGVLPGYVASEAYGVNNHRVVVGVLYDRKERAFPFRWKNGRITLLKGPGGRRQQVELPDRNVINDRGEIAGTLKVGGNLRAVRWTRGGKASFLPGLPGHTWTLAWSINRNGVVSGWSRREPNEDGENNPVIWTKSGKAVPMPTPAGRADGAAEATNRAGVTVGYLGNLGTDDDPESDQAAIWQTPTAEPTLIGPTGAYAYAELVDINDRGQVAGMLGTFTTSLFPAAHAVIWQPGWTDLRRLPVPAVSRAQPVVVTALTDINNRGTLVGNVYGLAGKAYDKLRRIDPVVWACQFRR
jgi:probable HAF family extracellular repeat protein